MYLLLVITDYENTSSGPIQDGLVGRTRVDPLLLYKHAISAVPYLSSFVMPAYFVFKAKGINSAIKPWGAMK